MMSQQLQPLLVSLLSNAESITGIAKPAEKHRKPLGGHNPYADRFHSAVARITATVGKVRAHLDGLDLDTADLAKFNQSILVLTDVKSRAKEKLEALRMFRMVCDTTILPKAEGITASPVPTTESVLPMAVAKGTRGYVERIVTQINGCSEHQWYDACSVMLRKLAEVLIIGAYINHGLADEIKDGDGHFFMMSKLIAQIKSKHHVWHLGKETTPCLDKMKELGDRAAHTRQYVATKADVDVVIDKGLRTTIEDLLHLAGLK